MRIGVVGAGVVGLATTFALDRLGVEVRCFEAGEPMAARSVGGTRIFRLAHAEPRLVAYAARALEGWRAWEREAGTRLVGTETTVVSGPAAPERFASMREAGAAATLVDDVADAGALPAAPGTTGPVLVDPAGGVIAAASTGRFLAGAVEPLLHHERVEAIPVGTGGDGATIRTPTGSWACDSVVVAAGEATASLVAPLGIGVPDGRAHHVRFTFPLPDAGSRPCWIDDGAASTTGLHTYQHASGPDSWAVGASMPAADCAWELGRDEVRARSLAAVAAYVREVVVGADADTVTEEVYCSLPPGLGDGVGAARTGPVLAVWGDNLFKFAPALGEDLARAAADGTVPTIAA
ncbi:MAG: FAD-dependent oxidoreductase [Actinomycetota bacterium]|nr:FAD-dependent oxidoreductase [Actinomycetota bacterium]